MEQTVSQLELDSSKMICDSVLNSQNSSDLLQ